MKRFFKVIIMILSIMQIVTLKVFADEDIGNLKDLESNIHKHLENRDSNFTFIYTGAKKEFQDNIRNSITNSYSNDDYLERSWLQIRPKANMTDKGIEITMDVTYLTTKEQEEYTDFQLEKITMSLVKENMSTLEKVKFINDYIINRYSYDYSQKSLSAYSALTTSLAVCQGYSMTAYKMFNYAGIENRIIVGKIKEVPHSWNAVKIEGNWYQLDITNNDSIEKNKYLLVSDDALVSNQYYWDREKYPKALKGYYK